MNRGRLTRAIRWVCVPVAPVVGTVMTVGAGMLSLELVGMQSGPLLMSRVVLSVLTALLFIVPAVLMAPSHRAAIAVALGVIVAAVGCWLAATSALIGALVAVSAIGASAFVVRQARRSDDLAGWPLLSPFFGRHRWPARIAVLLLAALSLGGLAVGPRGRGDDRRTKAKADLKWISAALQAYRGEQGMYPPSEEGLQILVREDDDRFLDRIPVDPWGRAYQYARTNDGFRVVSYGADGAPGGEGANADVAMRNGKIME